jgi:P-type Ca2+ transporter type 2C
MSDSRTSADPAWHQQTGHRTLELLASRRTGLSDEEVGARRAEHGSNELVQAERRSLLATFAAQFLDVMTLILLVAAVVSGIVGDLADTLVIAAIVVLNAVLGFVQEVRAERAMAALKSMAAPAASVIRDGNPRTIPAAELVPGDIVALEAGQIVPADLRLLESASLRVDESMLTGESVPVEKYQDAIPDHAPTPAERRNVAHSGSMVTYGRAIGTVVATGMRTELGRIAHLLSQGHQTQTPLQRRLASFGRRLALIVVLVGVVVFVAGLLRGEPPLLMLMVALSLCVAAIPESLVAVVSISLALGARRMASRHALIRRLAAAEALGSVTYICADKTGTLTANQMKAEQFYCDGEERRAPCEGAAGRHLLAAMAISHDAVFDEKGATRGDPTEVALLVAAKTFGVASDVAAARLPRIGELPFDSERKCMTTVHREDDGSVLSYTKGAVEVIVARCSHELRGAQPVEIDRARIARVADEWAGNGLRVLAVAMHHWPEHPGELVEDRLERDLVFVGLIGLIDPPRDEAAGAIASCLAAGIVPIMITGDHPLTARAIARRLDILPRDDASAVLTGTELAQLSMEEFERRIRDVRVYARVLPEQKVKIVTALQKAGEVVAMTGDGVNDAPALRRADIGVAMGLKGTDVAREAGAIVLLDDNFATIVSAVREGRRIFDNLRRFVRYVLTTNSAEVWLIFLAPLLGLPLPLLPIQILWINLVSDGLPGLALAAERAEPDVMRRPPRAPAESLFARGLGMHAFLVGLLMAGICIGIQAWYVQAGSVAWQTMVFTSMVFAQLGHVLAVRSEHSSLFTIGVASNPLLLASVVLTVGLQLMLVYLPAFNRLFDTVPLGAADMAVCVGAAFLILLVVETEKFCRRRWIR